MVKIAPFAPIPSGKCEDCDNREARAFAAACAHRTSRPAREFPQSLRVWGFESSPVSRRYEISQPLVHGTNLTVQHSINGTLNSLLLSDYPALGTGDMLMTPDFPGPC